MTRGDIMYNNFKTILITGAGGFLGRANQTVRNNPNYKIIAFTSNISKLH